ncbi:MAG: ATP12 family protein [Pseudomonadota bacterium]
MVKRFYDIVAWRPCEGGFEVTLDERPVHTPGRERIVVPTEDLADEIAGEWRGQSGDVMPQTMPITRLVTTAIDRVAFRRAQVTADLAEFGASDLVCYRADAPAELVAFQARHWQPLVDWARRRYGAQMSVTSGIMPVDQPTEAVHALAAALEPLTDFELMAVHAVTVATGSLIAGLAVVEGEIAGEDAWRAGLADEHYAAEVWGEDAEAKARQDALREEIVMAERLLYLLGRLPAVKLAAPHNE